MILAVWNCKIRPQEVEIGCEELDTSQYKKFQQVKENLILDK